MLQNDIGWPAVLHCQSDVDAILGSASTKFGKLRNALPYAAAEWMPIRDREQEMQARTPCLGNRHRVIERAFAAPR
jgi:hypothetical protein